MLVRGHREARVGVAESLGDNLDRRARGDEQTGMGMAQIVETDAGDVGAGEVPVEQLADRLGVHRVAGSVGEDRVTKLDGMPVTGLHPTPAAEECFGGWIEVDAAAACARLDWHLHGLSADDLATAGDRYPVGVVLPVAPAQPGDFTAAHAGGRGDVERRVEP